MRTITLSNARKDLFRLRDEVSDSHNPVILTHKAGNVVMLPEDDYWNIVEHFHIMRDKLTMKAIEDAIRDRSEEKETYKAPEELLNELEIRD